MAKYGKKAQAKVKKALDALKKGKLKSGKTRKTVKSRKQAIAIALSEARKEGDKVPKKTKAKKAVKRRAAKSTVKARKTSAAKKKRAQARKRKTSMKRVRASSRKKVASTAGRRKK